MDRVYLCLLRVSIVGFCTIRQKRIRGGSTYAEYNSSQCDPAIVALPRLARPGDTIDSVQMLARHHKRCSWRRQAGRQAGRQGGWHGRREDRREGRTDGGTGGGSKGRVGEGVTRWREEAMM